MGFAKELIYWFALPAQGLAIYMSVRRKLAGELPVFFALLIAGVLSAVARLTVYFLTGYPKVYRPYYYTYWLTGSILSAVALLAALELCARLFPGFRRVSFYRRLFPIAAIPILGIGLMSGLIGIMGFPGAVALRKIVFGFDASRIAFLFFFVVLMLFMGRTWKGYEFGIALGLSIDAAESMVSSGFFAGYPRIRAIAEVLGPFADDIASVIWLVSIWSFKKMSAEEDDPLHPEVLKAAEDAESTIKNLITRSGRG